MVLVVDYILLSDGVLSEYLGAKSKETIFDLLSTSLILRGCDFQQRVSYTVRLELKVFQPKTFFCVYSHYFTPSSSAK